MLERPDVTAFLSLPTLVVGLLLWLRAPEGPVTPFAVEPIGLAITAIAAIALIAAIAGWARHGPAGDERRGRR